MIDQNIKSENTQTQLKRFKYKQIQKFKTQFFCSLFAFNLDSAILFAGCKQKGLIKTFALNCKLKQIQTLVNNKQNVDSLIFMKKSKQLAFVNGGSIIVICNFDLRNMLEPYQELRTFTGRITCLLINEVEDLLISGFVDGKIQFWKKEIAFWNVFQTIETSIEIHQLSLSISQTRLIACDSKRIEVIELQLNSYWETSQIIENDFSGQQLCFINENLFIFQHELTEYLDVYCHNKRMKQFIKGKQIKLNKSEWRFPLFSPQFIKEKDILIVKYGKWINFFGIDKNGNVLEQQANQFNATHVYGKVTDNGRFLGIWDNDSRYIQISLFQFLE